MILHKMIKIPRTTMSRVAIALGVLLVVWCIMAMNKKCGCKSKRWATGAPMMVTQTGAPMIMSPTGVPMPIMTEDAAVVVKAEKFSELDGAEYYNDWNMYQGEPADVEENFAELEEDEEEEEEEEFVAAPMEFSSPDFSSELM